MSYAEAKEIAMLRLELRACWDAGNHHAAQVVLARLWQRAGLDDELSAEVRRWAVKLGLAQASGRGTTSYDEGSDLRPEA